MEALRLAQLDTVVHRLNPLTKLFIMLIYWTTALFTFNIPVLFFMSTMALLLYPIAHIPLRILRGILVVMAPIFVIFVVISSCSMVGTPCLHQVPFRMRR
jgi:energy-coupling factor transporter transmembrane protein EcfT